LVWEYEFPFHLVDKGSRLVLYGASDVGAAYVEQILATDWCKLVCTVDSNYQNIAEFAVPVLPPQSLQDNDGFDWVVIAVKSAKTTREIEEVLKGLGIADDKIMRVWVKFSPQSPVGRRVFDNSGVTSNQDESGAITIALRAYGGLGDHIVSLKIYEELTRLCNDCVIDVFCKPHFGRAVFENQPKLGKIYPFASLDEEKTMMVYDVVLDICHIVIVKKASYQRVKSVCPKLAEKLRLLHYGVKDYYLKIHDEPYRSVIHVRQAEIAGKNRYTSLGGEAFAINDNKVNIRLDKRMRVDYLALGLSHYITLNCGWGGDFTIQTKVWPLEHYKNFIQLLKSKRPDLAIVQVSGAEASKLEGADKHFIAEDLELVKYILKGSLLHIDSESGITHLATQLGTKCLVMFGPTPIQYYGYPQNINILPVICGNCMGIVLDWYTTCYRADSKPNEKNICMRSITPEMVLEKASEYLDTLTRE
jgi:ADP-heptose:LPS heptosyltransferase